MKFTTIQRLETAVEKVFPERRIFLRSDTETRYVRLSPLAQLTATAGSAVVLAWTIIASAVIFMDAIGSGNVRDQSKREQETYEARLNALSEERDRRAEEASAAQARFNLALAEVSQMQSALLAAEDRKRELERGLEVVQTTLRKTMTERDAAREKARLAMAKLEDAGIANGDGDSRVADIESTVDFLTGTLERLAQERDTIASEASEARKLVDDLVLEARLKEERNDRIFRQLEEAVAVSMEPLDDMFRAVGLPPDQIIEKVRQGYSGQGGPLTPLSVSTRGTPPDADSLRANEILEEMDRVNLYRIAAQKLPFDMPVKGSYRFTSGFGPRWGRMHNGADFAGAHATPIHVTADGVVTHAGWLSGYGRLIKVRHEFGFETRYAHLSKIRVEVGQRVSRGDRIGDMGNTGRSTGTHLHYEVHVNGNPVNPMSYIRAARDVF